MIRLSFVSSRPLQDISSILELDDLHFVNVELQGPDIRAVLNQVPVRQLDPYSVAGKPHSALQRDQ